MEFSPGHLLSTSQTVVDEGLEDGCRCGGSLDAESTYIVSVTILGLEKEDLLVEQDLEGDSGMSQRCVDLGPSFLYNVLEMERAICAEDQRQHVEKISDASHETLLRSVCITNTDREVLRTGVSV